MKIKARNALALLLAAALVQGCGSSVGSPSATQSQYVVSGTVATGKAVSNTTVTCADGAIHLSGITDQNGHYSIAWGKPFAGPVVCHATAPDNIPLYSVNAYSPTTATALTVNLTSLTTMLAAMLTTSGSAKDVASIAPTLTASALDAKIAILNHSLSLYNAQAGAGSYNPVTTSFVPNGTGIDAVLDAFQLTVNASGQPTLQSNAVSGSLGAITAPSLVQSSATTSPVVPLTPTAGLVTVSVSSAATGSSVNAGTTSTMTISMSNAGGLGVVGAGYQLNLSNWSIVSISPFSAGCAATITQSGASSLVLSGVTVPGNMTCTATVTVVAQQSVPSVASVALANLTGAAAAGTVPGTITVCPSDGTTQSQPSLTGFSTVVAPDNGNAWVQWTGATGPFTVQYKPTLGCSAWGTAVASTSANGYTFQSMTVGTSYDFRVCTAAGCGSTVSATPVSGAVTAFNNHVLSTGQSLSVGATSTVSLTNYQPYLNQMLTANRASFTPLLEPIPGDVFNTPQPETMSSALYDMISSLVGSTSSYYKGIVSIHGMSGQAYSVIKKGGTGNTAGGACNTVPYCGYYLGQAQQAAAFGLSVSGGTPYRQVATTLVHGETDQNNGVSAAQYSDDIIQMQNDYESDYQSRTGDINGVPLFLDNRVGGCAAPFPPTTPIGQWQASLRAPTKIFIVLPMYIFDNYRDNCHPESTAYRRMGEYFGKVMKKVLVDKQAWKPLSPKSITMAGNVITAQFYVPVAPLVFDTTIVQGVSNMGFEYTDSLSNTAAGTGPTSIASVTLGADGTSVVITLNQTPAGTSPRLRYAYTYTSGNIMGAYTAGAARGNLRDSDTTPALFRDGNVPTRWGNNLYNWGITFDSAIPATY
ncbi:hypothetical protein [Burkholderia ubonensis]|uniref:hypothetical protein n=1 Tax=Burkholderia ubonensis TaxID=101571 RepID=UPI000ADB5CC5|nr:hypothetical protein [Burkholderia ubonensis]